MTNPYLFLILAVTSFGMLGILHKVADHKGCKPEAANLFLFFGAAVLMSAYAFTRGELSGVQALPAAAWLTPAVCGVLTSIAILSFQRGIRFGKISTSWLVINLSTVLPTILSILLYNEVVSVRRAAGLLLAGVAIGLLWKERRQEEEKGAAQ
jgi:uncharacterized membrane protein